MNRSLIHGAPLLWPLRWMMIGLVPLAMVAIGCGRYAFFSDPEVKFTFDNRTDSALCYYGSAAEAATRDCSAGIAPRFKRSWLSGCAAGVPDDITVIITVELGGQQIYERTEDCRRWKETERRFVIEQRGDEYIVTDSFQASSP